MKLFRIAGLVIFMLSVVTFTGYKIYEANSVDTTGPVFNCKEDSITASVKTTKAELLKGVKAFDEKDGDVTDKIVLEKLSNFTEKGKRMITYTAFDSNLNVSKWERGLVYSDYTPPRFTLSKPLIFFVGEQDDIIKYMTATDCMDGDLTNKIKYEVIDDYFGESEKSYQMKFIVTNSIGDTACLPATVEFHYPDNNNKGKIPEITLSEYLVYIKVGDIFHANSYLDSVKLGNKQYTLKKDELAEKKISQNKISIQSKVNSNVPGTYEVTYGMTTEKGFTGTTRLLVVVEE